MHPLHAYVKPPERFSSEMSGNCTATMMTFISSGNGLISTCEGYARLMAVYRNNTLHCQSKAEEIHVLQSLLQ
jgi:hypothetical protein